MCLCLTGLIATFADVLTVFIYMCVCLCVLFSLFSCLLIKFCYFFQKIESVSDGLVFNGNITF